MKKISLTIGLVAALMGVGAVAAQADTKDAWLSTKAKIALLTTDGLSAWSVKVDTVDGNITIHGKVSSAAEKAKAEETIRSMDGVKDVKNLLQIVAPSQKKRVDAKDSDVKGRVEASLKASKTMDDIKVASVNNGVVLLSGKTQSLGQKLLAIERVYTVNGVHRVASEIETVEN
ncbi:MAG TPA: BON domain-containing protein [Vicinamibacteria bacterium]|jgi:hyperosmotically inducible protein|nr:BON domain-containing protein [Vicinamibacteria bacterium]